MFGYPKNGTKVVIYNPKLKTHLCKGIYIGSGYVRLIHTGNVYFYKPENIFSMQWE